ncbi:cell envelope biogenesis protein TolA [Prosthecomicrobium pneumaticum]|uniref:Outer membrane biosynthesis protein TonB n=1 Tax=Prosthecomicrobium pneumaticum TaxID=81895 RepID=A0A7W9CVE3_9HYPH|nr:cell envelope biogenesis protein TolA [Prosthecomicrobium pneumaticum]MBB5752603.1 outer membrane biosynthesis protein TonB [Prosthecomicrobium pneumaticum]
MRAGLVTSVAGHVLLVVWGLVSFQGTKPLDASQIEAIPVSVVPIDEVTSLDKGKKTAEVKEKPAPNDPTPKEAEKSTPAPKPSQRPTPPPPPPAAEPPPPPPEPEPTPEPPKPEPPKAEPPPEPPPPEPTPEPAPTEAAEAPKPQTPAPKPRVKPRPPRPAEVAEKPKEIERPRTPQQQAPETKDDAFDPDRIAALLDKREPTGSTARSDQPASFGASEAVNPSARLSQSELDALRSQVQRCWNVPIGWTDPREVTVVIRFRLNEDGSVNGTPQVIEFPASQYGQVSAESAIRAVMRCGPYQLPAEKYDQWSEVQMRFSPQG